MDNEETRKGRILGIWLLTVVAGSLSGLVMITLVWWVMPAFPIVLGYAVLLTLLALCLMAYVLLRSGRFQIASYLFLIGYVCWITGVAGAIMGFTGPFPIIYVLAIAIAGLLVTPRASPLVAGGCIIAYIIGDILETQNLLAPLSLDAPTRIFIVGAINVTTFGMLAVVAWLAAASVQQALARARGYAQELEGHRESLTQLVAAQTVELGQARVELELREPAAPVIPVLAGLLVLPLVGQLDETQAKQTTTALLAGIARHRARTVIIDLTGVAGTEAWFVRYLTETIAAVQLLGAECVLTGLRAELVLALLESQADLTSLRAQGTLQDAVADFLVQQERRAHRRGDKRIDDGERGAS